VAEPKSRSHAIEKTSVETKATEPLAETISSNAESPETPSDVSAQAKVNCCTKHSANDGTWRVRAMGLLQRLQAPEAKFAGPFVSIAGIAFCYTQYCPLSVFKVARCQ
jgi:hypothetical protein